MNKTIAKPKQQQWAILSEFLAKKEMKEKENASSTQMYLKPRNKALI